MSGRCTVVLRARCELGAGHIGAHTNAADGNWTEPAPGNDNPDDCEDVGNDGRPPCGCCRRHARSNEALAAEVTRLCDVNNNLTCAWEAGSDAQLKIRDERDQLQARVTELEAAAEHDRQQVEDAREQTYAANEAHNELVARVAELEEIAQEWQTNAFSADQHQAVLNQLATAVEALERIDGDGADATWAGSIARAALEKIRGSNTNDVPECEICQKLSPTATMCKRDQGDKHACSGWPDKGGHWRGGGA